MLNVLFYIDILFNLSFHSFSSQRKFIVAELSKYPEYIIWVRKDQSQKTKKKKTLAIFASPTSFCFHAGVCWSIALIKNKQPDGVCSIDIVGVESCLIHSKK